MTTQESSKSSLPVEKGHEEIKVTPEKARAKTKMALAQVKTEEQAGLKTKETLAETPASSAVPQAAIEPELRASIQVGQATAEAERALAEGRKASQVEEKNTKLPLSTPEGKDTEQRVSFVVRLTVDEQGRPRRTEIEHAQSGQKEIFPILDGQRLATFMQAYLRPQATSEPVLTTDPVAPMAETVPSESPRRNASLTFTEVQIFRKGTPGNMAFMFNADEPLQVQARFQLQGPDALSLTSQESSYEMRVHAYEVTKGSSTLLTRYQANLVKGILEYTPLTPIPGLSPGLYRLLTVVTLFTPIPMAGYYEGPVFEVCEVQPPIHTPLLSPSTMTR